ncbi:phage tail protein [Martelella sp. HB161492]|uniref:phage tail protein n=1 Tax=Martelella sp. HB161492 TaxID=2720726 RepID=UPI00159154B9|nr:phage tail protein [Martelella sp. HB161492]
MVAEVHFDASEIEALSRAIAKLPGEIKTKAMARAMRRMTTMARTRVVKRNAEHTKLPQRIIREQTTAYFNAGGNTIELVEKSGWIPLFKLGARQTRRGVRVRTRGSYKGMFIAKMESGHSGVFRRVGKERTPIREMFGPNPAHAITNNPDVYMQALAEIIQENLAPRFLHELDRILPGRPM